MIIFIQLFIFTIIVAAITIVDRKIWGTYFTPSAVLSWPSLLLFIVSFMYFKISFMHFQFNAIVIIIWIIGLIFFWLGGIFIKLVFFKAKIDPIHLHELNNDYLIKKTNLRVLFLLAYPLIIFIGYKLFTLLSKFNFNLADEEFQKNLGSGVLGHSILFLSVITIFLLIFFQKNYYKIHQVLIIIFTLIFEIFYGVKSWIIIPLISAFLGRLIIQKTKLKLYHALIAIIPFIVFWLIYQISLGMNSNNNEFIIRHMVGYLFAGPIGMSEHLSKGLPIGQRPEYAFTPIINAFRFAIGEKPLDVISNYVVSLPSGFTTNVKTFFGTLYIYGGYTYILTSFMFGLIYYTYLMFFCLFSKFTIAPFMTTLYAFMLGLLFMGWFDNYAIHLPFYEVPIWTTVLHYIFLLKKQI